MFLKMTRSVLYLFLFAITTARGNPVSVEFVENLYHYPEHISPVVQVKMIGSANTHVSVSLLVVNDTAYSGLDFTVSERTLTFSPTSLNQSQIEFRVNVIDDDVIEEEERFKLILETNQAGVTIGPRNEAVFLICNDEVSVEFMQPVYYVGENSSAVTIWLKKVGWDVEGAQVGLSTVDITAKAGKDYVGLTNKVISFPSHSSQATVNTTIQILNDAVAEKNETFKVNLNVNVPQNGGLIVKLGAQNETKIVIITDDDKATVEFTQPVYHVEEDSSMVTLYLRKVGWTLQAAQVSLSTVDITANAGKDYVGLTNKVISFPPNSFNVTINTTIQILDDAVAEGNETFKVYLNASVSQNGGLVVKLGAQNETKIIMTDDDKERTTVAQFKEQYKIDVEEDLKEEKIALNCVIDGAANIPVQISFLVNPDNIGTTAIEGEDFSLRNKSLTFQPGVQSLPLTIDIIRDQKAESSEIFVIKMISVNDSIVVIGKNDTATVKIGDKFDQEEAAKERQEREKLDEKRQTLLNFLVAAIVLVGIVIVVLIILCICICLARK